MRAKKSLGQNFLVGSHYPEKIVTSVAPSKDDTIIEIGPGHGAITGLLVATGADIIALELDSDLIPGLAKQFSSHTNFRLLEADALKVNICELIQPASTARVVANLPYYISTPIIQRLIGQRSCITDMTVMLQKEVVDRIAAEPGGKEYGYFSMLVQFYCEVRKLFDVPPGAFRPAPKIYSSVVRLRMRPEPAASVSDEKLFVELIKVLFSQRRKTVMNNLRSGYTRLGLQHCVDVFTEVGVDPKRRAETLSIAEAARICEVIFQQTNDLDTEAQRSRGTEIFDK